jgi:hypothetical protein
VRLTLELVVALAAAMRADRAIGPANGLKVLAGFVFVLELRGGKGGHGYLLDPYTALGIKVCHVYNLVKVSVSREDGHFWIIQWHFLHFFCIMP